VWEGRALTTGERERKVDHARVSSGTIGF